MLSLQTDQELHRARDRLCDWSHAIGSSHVDCKFKPMDCKDVPVMEILKEFRAMAGPKGRKAHRAAPKVSYEYEKHCDR
jgi:hypothetical protein